jgi:DNA-binding transcriptional MerR regulator/copper chaperone CopZ
MNQTFTVTGMTCGHCEKAVTRALKQLDPQAEIKIDRAQNLVQVESTQKRCPERSPRKAMPSRPETIGAPVNIGEAARRSGVSAKMLRHYESLGLLGHVGRTDSGYRQYGAAEVHTLRFIKRSRDLGFSMAEIGELVNLWQNRRRASASASGLRKNTWTIWARASKPCRPCSAHCTSCCTTATVMTDPIARFWTTWLEPSGEDAPPPQARLNSRVHTIFGAHSASELLLI